MGKYLLLLHETPGDFADASPEDIQKIIEEYSAWAKGIAEAGRMEASQKLTDDGGKHVRQDDGGDMLVTDGPYSETTEIIGGFFMVTADSYEDALALAETCPHLNYNGWIEVRQVHELPGN